MAHGLPPPPGVSGPSPLSPTIHSGRILTFVVSKHGELSFRQRLAYPKPQTQGVKLDHHLVCGVFH
jgi:hypothetical protein